MVTHRLQALVLAFALATTGCLSSVARAPERNAQPRPSPVQPRQAQRVAVLDVDGSQAKLTATVNAAPRERVSPLQLKQLKVAANPIAGWPDVVAAFNARDLRATNAALDRVQKNKKNQSGWAKDRIEVIRATLLMARAKAIVFTLGYLAEHPKSAAGATMPQKLFHEKAALVPKLAKALKYVLDRDLPTLATPLPTGSLEWADPVGAEARLLSLVSGIPNPTPGPISDSKLKHAANTAALRWIGAFIASIDDYNRMKRSPLTKQVLLTDCVYKAFLTASLMEMSEAGPRSRYGPLISRGIRTACDEAKTTSLNQEQAAIMKMSCAMVDGPP